MVDNTSVLAVVGSRLRAERERLGLGQVDLGLVGGVTRQSQSEYESGKRPFTVSYMLALKERNVDMIYVLTGDRAVQTLDEGQAAIIADFDKLSSDDRLALLRIASALSGRPAPAPIDNLPSTPALGQMFEALLAGIEPGWSRAEQALLLAQRLPIGLSHLRHAAPDSDRPPVRRKGAAEAPADHAMPDRVRTS